MIGFKKHRGLKRYYKNLATKVDLEKIDHLNFNSRQSWFDHWFVQFNLNPLGNNQAWFYHFHLHFDWYRFGNKNFKARKPHLDKLFRHFGILAEITKELKTNFQLYAVLLDYDSGSDALFLHPPHSDNDEYQYLDLQLTTTLTNKLLNGYIDNLTGYEKRYGQGGEAFCLLFKENVGQPF